MKWVFIFLLLINVLYLGWELDRQTSMEITRRDSIPTVPAAAVRLRFLDELATLPPLRNTEVVNPLDAAGFEEEQAFSGDLEDYRENDDRFDSDSPLLLPDISMAGVADACFSFGPIADESQAVNLRNWFVSHGSRARQRHTDEQGRQLFWIYLAPQESRQDAMATIQSFRDKGIEDFRLIVKGNLQNAISMGLFSSQAAVNKRLGELKRKGYKAVVVPYADGKRVYWIDALLPDDEAVLEQVFNDYPSRFSSLPVNCTEIALESEYS